jgi:hypothetical protein
LGFVDWLKKQWDKLTLGKYRKLLGIGIIVLGIITTGSLVTNGILVGQNAKIKRELEHIRSRLGITQDSDTKRGYDPFAEDDSDENW